MNEITLANIGEWIGKEVEVSEGGTAWLTYTLVGFDREQNRYVVAMPHAYAAWRLCRPPQPKHRVPTIADWGKECEFWDWNQKEAVTLILRGIIPERGNVFITASGLKYRNAQIEDKP